MLMPRLIPCLDVRDGRVVKGVRFRGLRDAGDPRAAAEAYAAQGADELVLLDVAATPEARRSAVETVRAVRSVLPIPLTVGGGVRSVQDAERLLKAGADKVGVNSAAVARPGLITELAERFGDQCVVLSIDAAATGQAGRWAVFTHGGRRATELNAVSWAREGVERGAGEVLLTSVDRDGGKQGYDLALVRAIAQVVRVPVVASGGARTAADLANALEAGASAVLMASILHDGETTVDRLKNELAAAGQETRR
ncbi:MAG: imidazole glycerol phosphate synthase subunit HisF [Planctomycetota bacterium]|nr:imidazole glycerol phosphate synthase subunit HisF [Planctomycetota bacterium]